MMMMPMKCKKPVVFRANVASWMGDAPEYI